MDLLFKRYASPFLLVDQMLMTRQFSEFVTQLFEFDTDERLWNIFLHKVEGQSFNEWKATLEGQQNAEMSKNEIETTVNNSFNILNGFKPTS